MKSSKKTQNKKSSISANYLNEWKKIVSASDLREALIDHFSYLADSPKYDKILTRVMGEALAAKISGKNLEVFFPGQSMIATPPLKQIPKHYPKSFAKLLKQHATVTFYRTLGEHKAFSLNDSWFEEPEYLNSKTKPFVGIENLVCPIADPDGDFWIYHPTKKKFDGEPVICFLNHESGEIDREEKFNAGSMFLKTCIRLIKVSPYATDKRNAIDEREWWNSLGNDWKNYFKKNPDSYYPTKYSSNPKTEQISGIMAARWVSIDAKSKIKTLEPLRGMTTLKRLSVWSPTKFDFSPLLALTDLEFLSLNGTSISSLEVLKNMTKLEDLSLFKSSSVNSIAPLITIKKLKALDLSYTNIVDLSDLSRLKWLKEVRITGTAVKKIEKLEKLPFTLIKN